MISSLNAPCSTVDKKCPDCRAKINVTNEKLVTKKSVLMMEILELKNETSTLQLGISERNLKQRILKKSKKRIIVIIL